MRACASLAAYEHRSVKEAVAGVLGVDPSRAGEGAAVAREVFPDSILDRNPFAEAKLEAALKSKTRRAQ